MQSYIFIGKAFGFKRPEKGIVGDLSAINGNKNVFAVGGALKPHILPKPTFNSATLIIIKAGAFFIVFFSAFKSVNIKLPHITADFFKVFNKFAIT